MKYKLWKKNNTIWSEGCWKYQAYIENTVHVSMWCACRKGSVIINSVFQAFGSDLKNNAVV